jgi:hypothetical protein
VIAVFGSQVIGHFGLSNIYFKASFEAAHYSDSLYGALALPKKSDT